MTATRTACQETIGKRAGAFGFEPVLCSQVVGVRQWYDSEGTLHAGCALHVAAMVSRYPEADPPRPVFLHEDPDFAPDPIDMARWESERLSFTDAGFTESELRLVDGNR